MPKISVIVPVYNTEKYLRRCVDSILAQTFRDFELLLVDDGSTDSSPAICDEYAKLDSRVRVFHKPNGGVSSARNLGLDNARGEWIAFADSDDWVYPIWLQNYSIGKNKKYDLITQGMEIELANTEVQKIGLSYHIFRFDDIKEFIKITATNDIYGYIVIKLFKSSIINNSNKMIRFNTNFSFMEDEDFVNTYVMECRSAVTTDGAGYHYMSPCGDKYKIYSPDRIPFYKYLLNSVHDNANIKDSPLARKYYHFLTTAYIENCKLNNYSRQSILELRSFIFSNFSECPIFFPTKTIIKLDRTTLISRYVLSLHNRIKK